MLHEWVHVKWFLTWYEKTWPYRMPDGSQISILRTLLQIDVSDRSCSSYCDILIWSREMFNKWQAQRWWGENYDRIMELYNVQRFNRQALNTPSRSEDGVIHLLLHLLNCQLSYLSFSFQTCLYLLTDVWPGKNDILAPSGLKCRQLSWNPDIVVVPTIKKKTFCFHSSCTISVLVCVFTPLSWTA